MECNELRVRKIWLSLFFGGIAFELVSWKWPVTLFSLLFSALVYYFCFHKRGTKLLTLMIWFNGLILGLFSLAVMTLYLAWILGNPAIGLDLISMLVCSCSYSYGIAFFVWTVRLRNCNRRRCGADPNLS